MSMSLNFFFRFAIFLCVSDGVCHCLAPRWWTVRGPVQNHRARFVAVNHRCVAGGKQKGSGRRCCPRKRSDLQAWKPLNLCAPPVRAEPEFNHPISPCFAQPHKLGPGWQCLWCGKAGDVACARAIWKFFLKKRAWGFGFFCTHALSLAWWRYGEKSDPVCCW